MSPVSHPEPASQLKMQVSLGLRNRAGLDQLLRDQQNPSSPDYHRWLTPAQFNARFGPSPQDLDAVVQWLSGQGMTVTATSLALRYVQFTGSVADAEHTFGTSIMSFGDGTAYSNITDPVIPARFSGVITAVAGLDNLIHSSAGSHFIPVGKISAPATASGSSPLALDSGPALPASEYRPLASQPDVNVPGVGVAFGPSDVYSFYNETPLLSAGVNGSGRCLAVIGDSDFTASAVNLFNSQFGLPVSKITTVLADLTNPGINGDELEALLDLEWSHAIAPGAPIRFYLGDPSNSTNNGPIVDALQVAVSQGLCGSIGISFTLCGGSPAFYLGTVSPIYAQAAAQGQSVFVATGDEGAAGVVLDQSGTMCVPGTTRNVNELGADPTVTAVGGTMFTPNVNGSGNNVGSVPEAAWDVLYPNPPPNPPTQLATGGGASAVYAKPNNPAYQTGPGVPNDGRRDVPDVSLIAAVNGPAGPGVFVGDETGIDCCIVGTSLSAQLWSGVNRLVSQLAGGKPLGPMNPRIYAMARAGLSASGFRDVTTGNNNFGNVAGFSAGPGYDQTTGWGTVDITKFANGFTPVPAPTISSIPGAIQVGAKFNIGGSSFSPGAKVNFFVATSNGPFNAEPLLVSTRVSSALITVQVPVTVPLGQGFVAVQVVNADQNPITSSNVASALLQGSAAAGVPTLFSINGAPLAPTSSNPSFATNNVQTVIIQGKPVKLGGTGFDSVNGVAVNVFCACPPSGNAGPVFVSPGTGGLSPNSFTFTLPANVPTGAASLAVINAGSNHHFTLSSNAVSVPVGARISVTSVSQSGNTITVHGTGFSTQTVINFFNKQGNATLNLGGLTSTGMKKIPLALAGSTQFSFTKPAGSLPGASYVQALNPPFVPFTTSSGNGGSFTLH